MARPANSSADAPNGSGNFVASAVMRWFGTSLDVLRNQNVETKGVGCRFQLPAVCSNQYRDSPVSTWPFPGMSVGRTTSKAEMRSVATISRASSPAS